MFRHVKRGGVCCLAPANAQECSNFMIEGRKSISCSEEDLLLGKHTFECRLIFFLWLKQLNLKTLGSVQFACHP